MKYLFFYIKQAYAVGYVVSRPLSPAKLPSIFELITTERILMLVLFVLVAKPLVREQKDPILEKERINIVILTFYKAR